MTEISRKNLEYTLVTQGIENIIPSREAISLCEKISDGLISADTAILTILKSHGIQQVSHH